MMKSWKTCTLLVLLGLAAAGCRSPYVETDIRNNSDKPIHLIEVDYPSASFGKQTLDPHATYHYHFKIQGSGPVAINFTDAAGKTHSSTGPQLKEGQKGSLQMTVTGDGSVNWSENLASGK